MSSARPRRPAAVRKEPPKSAAASAEATSTPRRTSSRRHTATAATKTEAAKHPRGSRSRASAKSPPKAPSLKDQLSAELLKLQLANVEAKQYAWMVLVIGAGASGRSAAVNEASESLDMRHVRTLAWRGRSDEELARPWLARYWNALPAQGEGAFVYGGWYRELYDARLQRTLSKREYKQALAEIERFERHFVAHGGVLVKVCLELDKKAQKERIEQFSADPKLRWRVQPEDREELAHAKATRKVRRKLIERSSWDHAPWHLIDARDEKARDLGLMRAVADAFAARATKSTPQSDSAATAAELPPTPTRTAWSEHPTVGAPATRYDDDMAELRQRLGEALRSEAFAERSLAVVFEGPDAAGKGGTIRRITRAMDARSYRVVPISAPNAAERARPYLWRFWEHVPPLGCTALFDRSWYGRVLVERVEGFARDEEWRRAYGELVSFERELHDHGALVLKFWLHTSKEEQARRFAAREDDAQKQYKLTEEDLRNRDKWDRYQLAADEMIARTHTEEAPWFVVPGDDKRSARVQVLRTVVEQLERHLKKPLRR